ncbi:MAG: Dabb family protein [Phycisphaeraceae bacterium]
MAVEHMVWLKFNEGVSADRVEEHVENLRSLAGRIPVVESVKIGKSFTDRARGFTHGMIVTLADREALPLYLNHPDHIDVAGPLREDAEVMAMDIEE